MIGISRRLVLAMMAASFLALGAPGSHAVASPERWSFEGFDVYSSIPASPSGLIFVFHGSGGAANFVLRLEVQEILSRFEALGYGYVSTSSTQRSDPRRWNNTTVSVDDSPDLQRLGRLYAHLIAETGVTPETPVFAMGMSNGAGFTGVFGYAAPAMGLPVKALALYQGPVARPVLNALEDGGTIAPLFVVLAENDALVSFAAQQRVAEAVSKAGFALELHVARERALAAADFERLPGVDAAGAQQILAGLVAAGIVDEAGNRLIDDEDMDSREDMAALSARLEAALPGHPRGRDIWNQLMIAWANHKMTSAFADEQVAFFERWRAR